MKIFSFSFSSFFSFILPSTYSNTFTPLSSLSSQQFPPTKKRLGVGQHPHRGFETITLAFQGAVMENNRAI
jgi:redox-sensitive bicupin YhaK (pirin superfamily)